MRTARVVEKLLERPGHTEHVSEGSGLAPVVSRPPLPCRSLGVLVASTHSYRTDLRAE